MEDKVQCLFQLKVATMPTLVRIETLWNLQNLRASPGEWNLYVNYLPEFEDDRVADVFDREEVGHFVVEDEADLRPHLEGFDNEIYDLVSAYEPISDLSPTEIKTHLLRYPSGRFGGKELSPDKLRHKYEVFYGEKKDGLTELVDISDLSASAQRAVRRLDDFAQSKARRQYEDDLQQFQELHISETAPSQQIRVFISHSKSDEEVAFRLYDILTEYGNHAYFDPILDEHDVPHGRLIDRLFERIEESHIFMTLVSQDYATEGSIARQEWEKSKEVAESRSFDDFFAPVFLESSDPTDYDQQEVIEHLKNYWYLQIEGPDNIRADNEELENYLERLAWSVPSRDNWNDTK